MSAHAAIKSASELGRTAKVLGSSLQCSVILEIPDEGTASLLSQLKDELEAMFVVSSVEINAPLPEAEWQFSDVFEVNGVQCKGWVLPPKESKCPRCWRYIAPAEDTLCKRCDDIVAYM